MNKNGLSATKSAFCCVYNKPEILVILSTAIGHILLIWLPSYPPLVDFPNHMARHYLESLALRGDSLPDGYYLQFGVMPNLGSDFVVPILLQLFSPLVAGKIFLTFSCFLYGLSAMLFISQQHAYSRQGCLAALFILPWLFNQSYFMGFLSFYSGVGLSFLAVWNHIRLFRKSSLRIVDIVIHTSFVTLLFFWHFASVCTYGALVGCHFFALAVRDKWRSGMLRRAMPILLSALPAMILVLYQFFFLHTNALSGTIGYRPLIKKFTSLDSGLFGGYIWGINAIVLTIWVAAIWITFAPRIAYFKKWSWLHLSSVVMIATFFLLPYKLGSTAIVDQRVLPVFLICITALLGNMPLRLPRIGLFLISITLIVRLSSIGIAWHNLSKDIEYHVQAIKSLPESSKVLVNDSGCYVTKYHPAIHVIAWGVVERKLFVSSLFAIPGQQPLRYFYGQHDHRNHVFRYREGRLEIDERLIPPFFEYFWYYDHWQRKLGYPKVGSKYTTTRMPPCGEFDDLRLGPFPSWE